MLLIVLNGIEILFPQGHARKGETFNRTKWN